MDGPDARPAQEGGARVNVPRDRGFVMPPDWVPHVRYWMAWPDAEGPWDRRLDPARDYFIDLARDLGDEGPVTVLANPAEVARITIAAGPGVGAVVVPHQGCCIRNIGPTFLMDFSGTVAGVAWRQDCQKDVARAVLEHQNLPVFEAPLAMTGHFIDVDGEGTCLASDLLPDMTGVAAAELERQLGAYLGVEQVVWLDTRLEGELSGGSLFNVARFLRPGVVLAMTEDDESDGNCAVLRDNLARLKGLRDARNRALSVVEVPQPRARRDEDGRRLPLSYANCFVNDRLVIVPAFEDTKDDLAYDRIVQAMMDHTVATFPAIEFAHAGAGLGTLVIGQPMPRALL